MSDSRQQTQTPAVRMARIADGKTAETAILELLADPDAAVVHSRNVQAGCYMFAIHRR